METRGSQWRSLWVFDLQLFAGEKTEEPTPKRRQEARKKGNIPQSREINSAAVLLVAFFSLRFFGPNMVQRIIDLFHYLYGDLAHPNLEDNLMPLLLQVSYSFLAILLPVLVCIAVAGLIVNFIQVGPVFSVEHLKPNLKKINPLEGFKRIFSKRSFVELIKSIIKIIIAGYVLYSSIKKEFYLFPQMMDMGITEAIFTLLNLTFNVGVKIGILLLILSVADLLYQRWEYLRDLRMTKQEVKEEMKQMEGDPQIKAKIRAKQRQMAISRMMHKVPKADVIITNPTHLAIAIQYVPGQMEAPVVIAKGQDKVAERIKEIARENRVSIVENKPLAQALYKSTEINQSIPLELYQAVADVLAFVYRLKKRQVG